MAIPNARGLTASGGLGIGRVGVTFNTFLPGTDGEEFGPGINTQGLSFQLPIPTPPGLSGSSGVAIESAVICGYR